MRLHTPVNSPNSSPEHHRRPLPPLISPVQFTAPGIRDADMAIMDPNIEPDLMKLWNLVGELSEQLSHTKQVVSSLHNDSIKLKAQALHNETGFVLRRFNLHLSQEEYDAELERMNATMAAENQGLQYDNKQLNSLLKEYEQTLDSVMSTFRKRAHDVQLQELETIKLYESLLVSSETAALSEQLTADTSVSFVFAQCSRRLRMVIRLLGGERPRTPSPSLTPPLSATKDVDDDVPRGTLETRCESELSHPEAFDWALEREIELARLEKENAELRMLLQAGAQADAASASAVQPLTLPRVPLAAIKSLMPRRPRTQGHSSFSSESSSGEFHAGHYLSHTDNQELLDMSDEVL
ncbi:hypothetical protein EW145_g947 [Phellinidium pouzarii]|uniref:Uncharacterized protein n=1 Tax=Phellinidium pouzarii TaxID=167371 RepID=A0A4S4LGG8_9AGAM|nr:hypothetical protein EW145_g947 [Phellinidium pouzarii]